MSGNTSTGTPASTSSGTTKINNNGSTSKMGSKFAIIALISLLLLIPLIMIEGLINSREKSNEQAIAEIASSYSDKQTIDAPTFISSTGTDKTVTKCTTLNYSANVTTDVLHRSIYEIITYNSTIEITGTIKASSSLLLANRHDARIDISDFKGLCTQPAIKIGGNTYKFEKQEGKYEKHLAAAIEIPQDTKEGDIIDFSITLDIKGTKELNFQASGEETTLNISSTYPHPSFQGDFLPENRQVEKEGFSATWRVLDMNINSSSAKMGVKFVDPANSYQQSMRSAKYGIIIIIMVFIAGLFVEFATKKEIHIVQYLIMGISLVLFYSLLLSFSELMSFGVSYIIAAAMTTSALTLYFRTILKHKSAYILGVFVALVYILNYMLLQMETYALIAGSLLLFVLLCGVMYLTSGINNKEAMDRAT